MSDAVLKPIDLNQFLTLPTSEVAEIVRASGTKTCVFPFNGTRRWFLLEYGHIKFPNMLEAYNDLTGKRYIEMYQMLFDHGIEAVIAPVFGGDIMDRGQEYMEAIGAAMSRLAEHPDFTAFYKKYDVRIHFYGDYRKKFENTSYTYLTDIFDASTVQTGEHRRRRLFYGVFGNDATDSIAEFTLKFYQVNLRQPTKREIVEHYYGEYVDAADIYIGFEKFNVFDYPMLNTGEEDLYFTAVPSLYMTDLQLRQILFDHIYLRPQKEPDYKAMSQAEIIAMREYYKAHRDTTYGLGEIRNSIWYVKL
jgi:tuberculosinol/isotuberculosinol synthase